MTSKPKNAHAAINFTISLGKRLKELKDQHFLTLLKEILNIK
jgi:hypothetical protein